MSGGYTSPKERSGMNGNKRIWLRFRSALSVVMMG